MGMFGRFFTKCMEVVAPFAIIARELTTLRELYEADLEARKIYRITEAPKDSDTEVSYTGEEKKPKGRLRQMLDGESYEEDEDVFS